jgi:hypothetical protein
VRWEVIWGEIRLVKSNGGRLAYNSRVRVVLIRGRCAGPAPSWALSSAPPTDATVRATHFILPASSGVSGGKVRAGASHESWMRLGGPGLSPGQTWSSGRRPPRQRRTTPNCGARGDAHPTST